MCRYDPKLLVYLLKVLIIGSLIVISHFGSGSLIEEGSVGASFGD